MATAPYNFIPINDKTVIEGNPVAKNVYGENLYTGYIDLLIKSLTPIYIRDGVSPEKYGQNPENTDFFNIDGKYLIPGSSLKGMIRTLVEIITFSKFKFIEDKRLYYRFVGARVHLNPAREYRNIMVQPMTNRRGRRFSISKAKPGFLHKKGHKYFLIPANENTYNTERGKRHYKCSEPGFTNEGNKYYVCSGPMFNKRHHYSFTLNKNKEKILLSENDINDYKNDITRNIKPDLLTLCNKHEYVPCFYIKDGNRYAFGHNPFFRLPYKKTIAQFIPKSNVPDITEAIFGTENDDKNSGISGKVFFEPAWLQNSPIFAVQTPQHPKILNSPKPTSFQLYLEQPGDSEDELQSYNDNTLIRGYKMYWHKQNAEWKNTDNTGNRNVLSTPIKPLDKNNVFKGRIRFENLKDYELGALLFALDLPKGLAHKIGLGKPLGLGSIRISPTLFLSNRKKRYSDLWAEWNTLNQGDINSFKDKFARTIIKILKKYQPNITNIWQHARLKQLKIMLDFDNNIKIRNWLKITEYMPLGKFRNREVLKYPSEVINT